MNHDYNHVGENDEEYKLQTPTHKPDAIFWGDEFEGHIVKIDHNEKRVMIQPNLSTPYLINKAHYSTNLSRTTIIWVSPRCLSSGLGCWKPPPINPIFTWITMCACYWGVLEPDTGKSRNIYPLIRTTSYCLYSPGSESPTSLWPWTAILIPSTWRKFDPKLLTLNYHLKEVPSNQPMK